MRLADQFPPLSRLTLYGLANFACSYRYWPSQPPLPARIAGYWGGIPMGICGAGVDCPTPSAIFCLTPRASFSISAILCN